jgi:hypothetical protein
LTGSTGQDDVAHAHTDPSYVIRNKQYDTDTSEEIRKKARNRRQELKHLTSAVIECRALALVAAEGTVAHGQLQADLQTAHDESLKRKRQVFEDDGPDDAHDPSDAFAPSASDCDVGDSFEDQF